jgi:type II secretory pathway pseudopilin PulG
MAIIGILSAVILPSMISKIEQANTVNEDAAQSTIADAILKGIRANARFPNPNVSPTDASFGWMTLAQNFFPGGVDALRYVFPKAQNFAQTERRVYLDPALLTYLNGSFGMPATGFASTDTDGDGVPDVEESALRMYIVSSSKSDLVLSCPLNGSTAQPASLYNSTLINDLLGWVKAYQDPTSANSGTVLVPTSIANWASVGGGNSRKGEYLHVKIVPVESFLCRIQLIDAASPPTKKLTGGNDYAESASILAQDGFGSNVYLFSNDAGTIAPGQNKDGSWSAISSYNDRVTYPSPNDVVVPPGTAKVAFTLPSIPKYQLNDLSSQTLNLQKTDFYVFAGASLKLLNSAGTVLLSKIIYQHSSFTFREGKWAPD